MSVRTTGEIERDAAVVANLRRIADALDAIHGTLAAMWESASPKGAPRGSDTPVASLAPFLGDTPPAPLEYSGKGQIVNTRTGELASPRSVVGAYNLMRKVLWGNLP